MNKHDFVRNVAAMSGEKIGTVEAVLDCIAEVVKQNVANKEETNLGFIKVKTTEKAARTGRNPKTGEETPIAARTAIKFVVTKSLKDAANGAGK